ncbi:unnamed protein product (macronuclear) [Paramecium tetraurelia]|uniref:Cyclin n=1 Tax=Paramecium tetraurelia TaxID=5888 RepID=A0EE78_PARTE|nr:uncharacterized protein GSPATT00025939001 [Paramecium tetraurelia]CAK93595.1 unnamed protein product [Paramecium tetraurelia]|eukprot:XP_001460992.1 hypothetical protein (macronuclear) [Paramecium tetraurelia strain d4-2]
MSVILERGLEESLEDNVIYAIAKVLEEIVKETDIIESPIQTVFHTNKKPQISIYKYIERIKMYSYCSNECFVLALIYIDRVQERNQDVVINSYCVHRLNLDQLYRFMLACILMSIKYNDDDYYKNDYYSRVGGITLQELNALEQELLTLLDYQLFVSQNQYYYYKEKLMKYAQL